MSYRTNNRLHVVLAIAIGLFALPVGGAAGLCWWQLFARTPLDGNPDFWVMFALAAVLTIATAAMIAASVWVVFDVWRTRRM